ncbi:hypothetical protein SBRCBS47491_008624 [Sporothrix bragantina]|uniref:Aminoglycoside phosphotransferase domain-containing protein n=1 Tax=Sporothrix bragantina TaxID=671064 RepID=A0ABP0CNC6_9PEZI
MAPPTNGELNAKREEDCFSVTPERKYYRCGDAFVKRSLRPSEWQQHNGYLHVPIFNTERVLNEGACLRFLAKNCPSIPVPQLHACFEDDGAAYLITEYVEGVGMDKLSAADQAVVARELEQHLDTLHSLTYITWGGPLGHVLPPYRVLRKSDRRPWRLRPALASEEPLVFCHNDLSANNAVVDPATLKIRAIVDWEYGRFFPAVFEKAFYLRAGPSVALPGEDDDTSKLEELLAKASL